MLTGIQVYSLDDVGGKILGRAGRGFFSFAFYFCEPPPQMQRMSIANS
jgi:hypothetical protein